MLTACTIRRLTCECLWVAEVTYQDQTLLRDKFLERQSHAPLLFVRTTWHRKLTYKNAPRWLW